MGARGNSRSPYHGKPNLRARWGPGQIEREERDHKCIEMRRAGHTWATICEKLGYSSPSHARDRYTLMLERLPAREGVEEQRELEMARLDAMMVALEPKIKSHDVRAVEVMIKLMERRARMAGYDMPVRQQLTVINDELASELVKEWRKSLEEKRAKALEAGIPSDIIDGTLVEPQKEIAPE